MSREDAPRFRSVPDYSCADCKYQVNDFDTTKPNAIIVRRCDKYNFMVPYPVRQHICDSFEEGE